MGLLARSSIRLLPVLLLLVAVAARGEGQRAEGFQRLPEGARVAVMPLDIELFSVSAGGILEPMAEWTERAHANVRDAFLNRRVARSVTFVEAPDDGDERMEALNRLHGAVGQAIRIHHQGILKLPTKQGKLDWSLGEDAALIKEKTGADYALFSFVRDSYASGERVAAMVVGALLGVGLAGGAQVGYASLVDLSTGRIVWFNQLVRASGDLREPDKARESVEALLSGFPE